MERIPSGWNSSRGCQGRIFERSGWWRVWEGNDGMEIRGWGGRLYLGQWGVHGFYFLANEFLGSLNRLEFRACCLDDLARKI